MHYDVLYPNRFLKATTIEHPITIRILSISGEDLDGDDGVRAKGVLKYRTAGPDGKPIVGEMVCAKTNAVLIAAILGTPDIEAWSGHLITIANDPSVMFGKERVGGIRVYGSPELKKPLTVDVKRPRRKKPERYVLQPTDNQGRVRTSTAPVEQSPDESPQPPAEGI